VYDAELLTYPYMILPA